MKQIKYFDIRKMGHKAGYCLQNVRLGFGIPALFYDAKQDMLNNKNKGTLHSMDTLPHDVQVPVYVDSSSAHEHIIAYDRGTFYTDGKRLTSTKGIKFFGWGELCENVRVVEYTSDKYAVGQAVVIDVPVKPTGATRDSSLPQGGKDVQVDDERFSGERRQYWVHQSVLKDNSHIKANAVICYVGKGDYIVQVFDKQFWIKEQDIKKVL